LQNQNKTSAKEKKTHLQKFFGKEGGQKQYLGHGYTHTPKKQKRKIFFFFCQIRKSKENKERTL